MTTIVADSVRHKMSELLEAGDGYGFLGLAVPYIELSPHDHYIRLMTVQEYLKLGLVKPARDLVEAGTSIPDAPDDFRTLSNSISSISAGTLPWEGFQETFESNLTLLADAGVDTRVIRVAWESRCGDFEVYRDRNGFEQVRMHNRDGRWRWIPCVANHSESVESQPLPEDIDGIMPGPYLFEGVDLGDFFRKVYEKTLNTFHGYSCALYIIETDPATLGPALHLRDWKGILNDPRVFLFTGESAGEQLRAKLEENVNLPWPQTSIKCSRFQGDSASECVGIVQSGIADRIHAIEISARDIEARYAVRDIDYWSRRFDDALSGGGEPLRILAAVSTHTTFLKYSMRDVQRALEMLGHKCVVLTEKTNHEIIGPLTYHNVIRELDPDIFLILDHLRPEFGALIPKNLPVLTWDQDCLPDVFTKEKLDLIAKHDFIVGCSKPRFIQLGYDHRQYLSTVIPTSPEQFSGEALTNAELTRYSCDVSYVSHASQTPETFHNEELARCTSPKVAELLAVLYELMPQALKLHGGARTGLSIELIAQASHRCGIEIQDKEMRNWLTDWYLWRLADRIFRHEALEWVASWAKTTGRSFRIYGNGWNEHPSLAEFAAGPAKNGRELVCVHRASRINLQLMPAGFLHQRAMDGLASGGFFLTRRVASGTGATLRRLLARTELLGVNTSAELVRSSDPELRSLLRDYLGDWVHRIEEHSQDTLVYLRTCAELDHPEDVFPRLCEIEFDSASGFAAAAERFLADDGLRRSITEEMRGVVVERFSYQTALDRFLNGMASYLLQASEVGIAQLTA